MKKKQKLIESSRVQKINCRYLRNCGTHYEKIFWYIVRDFKLGQKIRRQVPIGPYIVDFCCVEKKLVIELDGWGHELLFQKHKDEVRDGYLKKRGLKVMRIKVDDVYNNLDEVMQQVRREGGIAPSPRSPCGHS